MKRFLVLAAILASALPVLALAQNAPSNAVWVGVSVNVTNGTVSPPILEQRIAGGGGGGGGIDTNAFIPKWPSWYNVSGFGGSSQPTNSGFGRRNLGPHGGLVLQSYSTNNNGPMFLEINAIGPSNNFLGGQRPYLTLHADGNVNITAGRDVKVKAQNIDLSPTNGAPTNAPIDVTWNGVTKHGWDDAAEPAFTNGTARSVAFSPLDYDEWTDSSLVSKAGVFAATGDVNVLVMRSPGGNVINIHDGGEIDLGEDGSYVFVPGNLEATNDIKAASLTLGNETVTNWDDVTAGVEARVADIEGDYLTSEDAAAFATTGTVASVERRIERLEMPETCVLWWTTNLVSGTTNWVPTNFPTRKLEIRMDRGGLTNVFVHVNGTNDYGREVEISILSYASTDGHNVIRLVGIGTSSMGNLGGNNARLYTFSYDPATATMRAMASAPSVSATQLSTVTHVGGAANDTPTGPCTVEEWLERYQTLQ